MAYDLVGCMELAGGKYRPVWTNPCTAADMPGCMELAGGKYRPKLVGGFGICTDDKTGCMELSEGKYRPILTYDEYDSSAELIAACCVDCDMCVGLDATPFIEITFTDILWCPDDGGGYDNPNQTFTLEYDKTLTACWRCIGDTADACVWSYVRDVPPHAIVCDCILWKQQSTGITYIFLGLTYDSGIVGCSGCAASGGYQIFNVGAMGGWVAFSCLDTNYTNVRAVGNCDHVITQGYDGDAVINWTP